MRTALAIGFILASSAGELRAAELRGAIYDWSGLYVGAHAGKSWGETGNSWRNTVTPWSPDGDISYDNAAAGLHVGYMWQQGWLAYGLEGDITWSSLKGNDGQIATLLNVAEMNYFSTIRARAGVVYGNALLFATAGIAFGEITKKDLTSNLSNSNDLVGWSIGGGMEYAFSAGLRARVEYQYIDFGSVVSGLAYDHRADDLDIQSVRGGLSYGF